MTRTRTKRRGPSTMLRCRHCQARIRFLWITFSRGPIRLPFDHDPVTVTHDAPAPRDAYPTFAGRAWDLNDLTAEVQVMRGRSVDDARTEVLDMPWHRLHRCPQGAAARRHQEDDTTP